MVAEGNAGQLLSVVILLAAAVVAVSLLKRIGLGSVVGYLAAGLIIGPFGLQLINDPHTIVDVAELGVAMFLFVIGLEMKPSHLWELRRQIFGLGSLQVVASYTLSITDAKVMFDELASQDANSEAVRKQKLADEQAKAVKPKI